MADIAAMDLVEADPINYEEYQEQTGFQSYAPPPEGKYTAKAPIFTEEAFGATKEGYLKVTVDPIEIIGPTNAGYKIRYQMPLSAKKYSNREGNSIIDFLRAVGLAIRPKTNAEYVSAVKMASGRPFQFGLVWEAYNKDTQETTKGESNFPPDPQDPSKRQPFIQDEYDSKKKIYANGKVKYYISAVAK